MNRMSAVFRGCRRILLLTGATVGVVVLAGAANAADTYPSTPGRPTATHTVHTAQRPVQVASPACIGAGCAGKRAAAENCDSDAIAIAGFHDDANIETANLLYSPSCDAAWGEYTESGGPVPTEAAYQLWMQSYNGAGLERHVNATADGTQTTLDTPMEPWIGSVKFCVNATSSYSSDPDPWGVGHVAPGEGECTRWR